MAGSVADLFRYFTDSASPPSRPPSSPPSSSFFPGPATHFTSEFRACRNAITSDLPSKRELGNTMCRDVRQRKYAYLKKAKGCILPNSLFLYTYKFLPLSRQTIFVSIRNIMSLSFIKFRKSTISLKD